MRNSTERSTPFAAASAMASRKAGTVAHDDAVEKAEPDEIAGADSEHLLRVGGGGQHAPVGTMANDDVADIASEQARARVFSGAEQGVGAPDTPRTESHRGSVKERRADCEPGESGDVCGLSFRAGRRDRHQQGCDHQCEPRRDQDHAA